MITKILKAIEEFESARAKATQGNAEVFRMDSDCGYFNFMLEMPGADNHIIAHFGEIDNSNSKNNAAFFCKAANNSTKFTQALKVVVEALKYYSHHEHYEETPTLSKPGIRQPGVLTDKGHKARETLSEIEGILNE